MRYFFTSHVQSPYSPTQAPSLIQKYQRWMKSRIENVCESTHATSPHPPQLPLLASLSKPHRIPIRLLTVFSTETRVPNPSPLPPSRNLLERNLAPPFPSPLLPELGVTQYRLLMATPPAAAQSTEKSMAVAKQDGQRSIPTPFLTKTYQLVDDPAFDDVISWNEDGSTFTVWRPPEFSRDLLPKYFKHNNFSSFVRQLNTYGFRKIVPDRWEFANDSFKRGQQQLLADIHRRKISQLVAIPARNTMAPMLPINQVITTPSNSGDDQVISLNSSAGAPEACSSEAELRDENDRLRQENTRLSLELGQIKSLCDKILHLMSAYGGVHPLGVGHAVETAGREEGNPGADDQPEIENMPPAWASVKRDPDACPRLFGVRIGSKRGLDDEDEEARRWAVVKVKTEPSEPGVDRTVTEQGGELWRL